MAWTYCERRYGMASRISCDRQWHGLTVSALMAWTHEYLFPIPHPLFFLRRPTSFPTVLTSAPNFLPVLVGRVGVWTMTPSYTAVSIIFPVSSTRVSTSSAIKSRAVTVVLSLWVSWTLFSAPVPVSPVGFLISTTTKLSILWWIHGFPGYLDVTYHLFLIVSLHRRMWARAGSDL